MAISELSPTVAFEDRRYYFMDETTRAAFEGDPYRYADPERRM